MGYDSGGSNHKEPHKLHSRDAERIWFALSQEQLNAVAQATVDFMTANITDNMDTDQKIKAAYDYILHKTDGKTYSFWVHQG